MLFRLLLVLLFVFVAAVKGARKCPEAASIYPCTCRTLTDEHGELFSILSCHHLHSEIDLHAIVTATRGYEVFELELIDCVLRYLPHNAFEGTYYEVLSVQNSSIHSLSDTNVAFQGLEKSLHLIEIVNCTYTSGWDWSQLSHLTQMMEVTIRDSELIDVTDGISTIQHIHIEAFVFQKNKIEVLGDHVFAPFGNINRLALDNNHIKELKRSMFPYPAKNLKILGLSYNNLRNLPADLFLEMPALKSLYLTGNPLYTIQEAVFGPIWDQIHLFLFYGTTLSCDCRLIWLTKADNSKKFIHAECQGPAKFKGRPLSTVQPHELWC